MYPANIYLFKVSNRNTRERCEAWSTGICLSGVATEAAFHRCSIKLLLLRFCKIHRKIPAPESLF